MDPSPLTEHYRTAAKVALATGVMNIRMLSPARIAEVAADGAVAADRERMAEQLRNRVLLQPSGSPDLPTEVNMMIDAAFLTLADQIQQGMPPA